jgi:hypothetical protein
MAGWDGLDVNGYEGGETHGVHEVKDREEEEKGYFVDARSCLIWIW